MTDSNCRHPTSQIGTLPTELIAQILVPPKRLELSRLAALEPKSSASTNSAKGAKTFLNICMATANVNLGIEALLTYAATSTYKDNSSWTTEKEFKPAEWWQRLDSNQPHTDFQSAALPDELRRQ